MVAGSVVGHHSVDGDAVVGEPLVGSECEPGCGDCLLVVEVLDVGEAGVVVDGGVDVVVAKSGSFLAGAVRAPVGPAVASSLLLSQSSPSATIGDPAQLFDVDVDQLTRSRLLVAADHLSGGSVHPPEPVQPVTHQDSPNRRGRHVGSVRSGPDPACGSGEVR